MLSKAREGALGWARRNGEDDRAQEGKVGAWESTGGAGDGNEEVEGMEGVDEGVGGWGEWGRRGLPRRRRGWALGEEIERWDRGAWGGMGVGLGRRGSMVSDGAGRGDGRALEGAWMCHDGIGANPRRGSPSNHVTQIVDGPRLARILSVCGSRRGSGRDPRWAVRASSRRCPSMPGVVGESASLSDRRVGFRRGSGREVMPQCTSRPSISEHWPERTCGFSDPPACRCPSAGLRASRLTRSRSFWPGLK